MKNNKFNNSDGLKKDVARKVMVKSIINSDVFEKPILSLPFHTCEIERMLLRKNKTLRFLGVEVNPDVYWKMFATIGKYKLPITPYQGFLKDQINNAKENQYSHIIADYCGQLNSHYGELETILRNKLVEVGGTISLTFSTRIGLGASDIYDQMEYICPVKEGENKTEHAVKMLVKIHGKRKFIVQSVFKYKDTHPMILIVIKRVA